MGLDKATKRANYLNADLKLKGCKILRGKNIDEIPEFKPRITHSLSPTSTPVSQDVSRAGTRPPSFSTPMDSVELVNLAYGDPHQTLTRASSAPILASLPAPICELNADSSPKMDSVHTRRKSPPSIGSPPKTATLPQNVGSSIWSDGWALNSGLASISQQASWETLPPSHGSVFGTSQTTGTKPRVSRSQRKRSPEQKRREPLTKPPKAPSAWDAPKLPTSSSRNSGVGFPKVGSQDPTWSQPVIPVTNSWSS